MEEQLLLFSAQEMRDPKEDVIIDFLSRHGAPFERWQYRFARFWQHGDTTQAKAGFLREEFGTGGCGVFTDQPADGHITGSWDAKGFELTCKSPQLSFSQKLSWTEVAKRYDGIIPTWDVLETENAMVSQCEAHNVERCATCGKAIEDGQEYYDIEGVERNCSEDCLNVALDSLHGVGRWQRHDIGDGTDVRYTALIGNEWRPLPINLALMQEA